MTRPTIKAFIEGAAPQMALPTSKMKMDVFKRVFVLKYWYKRPTRRIQATEPMGKPMPTQAISLICPNCSYTAVWTSAAIVVSRP